jgi:hypothetical protein
METVPNWKEMIPELSTFLDGKPIDPELWLHNIGRYDHAVAYALLFWPSFLEHDGCVLLGNQIPETYDQWKTTHNSDTTAIEATLNHRHILDLFPTAPEPNGALVAHFGRLLKEMWSAKLMIDFPNRKFEVEFSDNFDLSVDNPSITFYTRQNEA